MYSACHLLGLGWAAPAASLYVALAILCATSTARSYWPRWKLARASLYWKLSRNVLLGYSFANRPASVTTPLKSSSSRNAPTRARLASSAVGLPGDCDRKTWIIRIVWRSSSDRVTPAAASSRRRLGSVNAFDAAWARTWESPKKSLSIVGVF